VRFFSLLFLVLFACAPEATVLGRPYEVRSPEGATEPLPMLVLAHGYGANGWAQDVVFPFSKQVEARRFHYVLPNGTLDANGRRFWNGSDYCCNFGESEVDDVAFFRALVEDVKAHHAVQPGRVFIVGHSNGGFMALRLACEAPELFDGIVSVSGAAWNDFSRCPDGHTPPLLVVHGTLDDTVLYLGEEDLYPSATQTAERFARRAGCSNSWELAGQLDLIGDSSEAETQQWRTACPPGNAVELWSMVGEGHVPQFDGRWTNLTLDWLLEHAP
jgi:polyhydroxybutyrate depolymerase